MTDPVRDPRYAGVEASIFRRFVEDGEGGTDEVVTIEFTTTWEGNFYWQTQMMLAEDYDELVVSDLAAYRWVLNEMVDLFDETIAKGPTEGTKEVANGPE